MVMLTHDVCSMSPRKLSLFQEQERIGAAGFVSSSRGQGPEVLWQYLTQFKSGGPECIHQPLPSTSFNLIS
ncbi:hypothetical protein chiPu_0009009 [Chiloscyllium punctatum]|uniref:Uncharacterized protein n=1 Tax=Chiloscyllium punctatum TaxID=137246 RepID=A0A401SJI6_CHIPU|nr:hypothetical protein [Chiloscyllium punctatum]